MLPEGRSQSCAHRPGPSQGKAPQAAWVGLHVDPPGGNLWLRLVEVQVWGLPVSSVAGAVPALYLGESCPQFLSYCQQFSSSCTSLDPLQLLES